MLFLGAHTLTTQREVRARVIAASGEGGYKLGYALVSFAGLALIAWGFSHYRANGYDRRLGEDGVRPRCCDMLKHSTAALMLPAVIMVVAAYIRGRIYTTLKHPMLAGVKAVGGGASARQRRSRLDHPVRLVPWLGGVRPDFAQASR